MLIIIIYSLHAENFRIKKPCAKIKNLSLINYSTICCQNRSGTTIYTFKNHFIEIF